MYKKSLINFLFFIGFPLYGYGSYISREISPTQGFMVTLLPYFGIVLFYLIDIAYTRDVKTKLNGVYPVMLLYLFSGVLALFQAVYKGLPIMNLTVAIAKSFLNVVPFHAFIIVYLYNRNSDGERVPWLAFYSLSFLLLMNYVAYYALGVSQGHSYYEGRVDFPYFQGAYESASVITICILMMIWQISKNRDNPAKVSWMLLYILISLYPLYYVNQRMTILLLIMVTGLFVLRVIRVPAVFYLSFLTLPILLNTRFVLFKIFSHPVMSAIMVRSDFSDLVTFNGRSFLWERGFEWLLFDRRGLLFGLGHEGQYFISLLRDIEIMWHPEYPYILHFHSTSLEVLVNQGLLGAIPLAILLYKLFFYYRGKFENKAAEGIFFMVVVYLLYDIQINTFVYFQSIGTAFLAFLVARVVIKDKDEALAAPATAKARTEVSEMA